ncbi:MAG TPA: signal peptidase I [Myxococcota bacterium]|nr:signal peptidase I [Myxococcota bacterium]
MSSPEDRRDLRVASGAAEFRRPTRPVGEPEAVDAATRKPPRKGFFDDLPTLFLALAIAFGIRTFVFQSFYVPSDSMFPTLLIGDHVFVSKLAYGPRVPFLETNLPGYREPRRGEVVVFQLARDGRRIYAPDHRPELPTEAFIKRLVALPGETVELRQGVVYVNGAAAPQVRTGERFTDPSGRSFDVLEETLGECRHRVLDDPRIPPMDLAPFRVEEGRYFFLGDNRDNSYDSRGWGSVRALDIEGPAGLLYWSWDFTGSWLSLLNPLTWIDNLSSRTRWDRMGKFVRCLPPREAAASD